MGAWEDLEKNVQRLLALLDGANRENDSLKAEQAAIKKELVPKVEALEMKDHELSQKVAQLEEEKSELNAQKQKAETDIEDLKKEKVELERVRDLTRLKMEEMIAQIEKIHPERQK